MHAGQYRKQAAIPYISHPLAVCAKVLESGGDEDQAIAALLHDAVEDCGGLPTLDEIKRRYGDRVARIVLDCSDSVGEPKPPWEERKQAYLASLANKPKDSLLVALADKSHNAECIVRDLLEHGDEVWSRFTASREEVCAYYRALAETFARVLPAAQPSAFEIP